MLLYYTCKANCIEMGNNLWINTEQVFWIENLIKLQYKWWKTHLRSIWKVQHSVRWSALVPSDHWFAFAVQLGSYLLKE